MSTQSSALRPLCPARCGTLSHAGARVRVLALLTVFVVLVSGVAFATIENISTWQGVDWALAQVTTAGSDVQPITEAERIIASVIVLAGLGFGQETIEAVERNNQERIALIDRELRRLKRDFDRMTSAR